MCKASYLTGHHPNSSFGGFYSSITENLTLQVKLLYYEFFYFVLFIKYIFVAKQIIVLSSNIHNSFL